MFSRTWAKPSLELQMNVDFSESEGTHQISSFFGEHRLAGILEASDFEKHDQVSRFFGTIAIVICSIVASVSNTIFLCCSQILSIFLIVKESSHAGRRNIFKLSKQGLNILWCLEKGYSQDVKHPQWELKNKICSVTLYQHWWTLEELVIFTLSFSTALFATVNKATERHLAKI